MSEIDRNEKSSTPGAPFAEDMSIKDFLALLNENGLEKDAQALTQMVNEMNYVYPLFDSMRSKILELQHEVDMLRGDTPLTDQFKKEMQTRSFNMMKRIDDLAERFIAAKDAIIDAAREGIHNFAQKGKSALHRSCVAIFNAGLKYFEAGRDMDQKVIDNSKEILARVDELSESSKMVRQQRGNLLRSVLGIKPKENIDPKEGALLSTIRRIAEADLTAANENFNDKTKVISKLEDLRDRHLEAAERKPSINDMLNDAKNKADQQRENSKNKVKDRGPSEHTLQ